MGMFKRKIVERDVVERDVVERDWVNVLLFIIGLVVVMFMLLVGILAVYSGLGGYNV